MCQGLANANTVKQDYILHDFWLPPRWKGDLLCFGITMVILYLRFETTYRYGITALRCLEFQKNAYITNVFIVKRRPFVVRLHFSAQEDRHQSLYKIPWP